MTYFKNLHLAPLSINTQLSLCYETYKRLFHLLSYQKQSFFAFLLSFWLSINAFDSVNQHIIQLIPALPTSTRCLPSLRGNRSSNLDYNFEHGPCSKQEKDQSKKKIETYIQSRVRIGNKKSLTMTQQKCYFFFSFRGRQRHWLYSIF